MNNNIPFLDLLCNSFKMQNKTPESKNKKCDDFTEVKDDNDEIMELLQARLKLGRERYGHGMIVDDDTKKYGTKDNDWELMALEEMLDGLIYTTASIIRFRRNKKRQDKPYNDQVTNDDMVINYRRL